MREPDNPTTWSSGNIKPTWLVAIDCSTLASLLLAMSLSAIILVTTAFKAWRGRAIQLYASDRSGEKTLTRKEALSRTLLHNMDHTLHEDGDAVDEASFWRSVSPVKDTSSLI